MIKMNILIDDKLTNMYDEYDFYNELQYQINQFLCSDLGTHRYYSAYLPIAIEMYFSDENCIYVEESPVDYEEIFGRYKTKNGGRFL